MSTTRWFTTSALLLSALTAAGPAAAQPFANAKNSLADYPRADVGPHVACAQLEAFRDPELADIHARTIPASAEAPEYCRVNGILTPEIAFEVNLPAKWNRRFYMIGNGGHAGEALDDPNRAAQRAAALQQGFVMAQTNTGHDSKKEPQATFILSNPQKAIDYAYRAVHLTAVTAKRIAAEYYGQPVAHAYWNSCSNGGRQGLIEAQRFPGDFDGIVANAPWVDYTGFVVAAIWNQRALSEAPVSNEKLAMVAAKVMAKCDRIDGLADGLIDDPRRCDFDPTRDLPTCAAGTDSADCVTPAQASALKKVYDGPVSGGRPYFPGFMYGSEAVIAGPDGSRRSGWVNWITPPLTGSLPPADFALAESGLKYLVFPQPQPNYDVRSFDFDQDLGVLQRWGKLANANNPDLTAFHGRGGKLIMTYGWADAILMPLMGVNYYERALKTNGPGTPDFFRLFMVPGMAHCSGGVGPDQHDSVTAVIDWVEKGRAPDSLIASKVVDDHVVRTRPLCPYPQVARYKGTGSVDEAANFNCVAPPR